MTATRSNCWKIAAKTSFDLGESTLDLWFSETLGFVRMNYRNYAGQYLEIELAEVVEN
ncbi:MAG: hypothetical protein R2824_12600 [Saprospiraceae bacterium]|nr:hypothetical protein [Lewinella sp.]